MDIPLFSKPIKSRILKGYVISGGGFTIASTHACMIGTKNRIE